MADLESSSVLQQPSSGANTMNLNSIPLLASAELLSDSNSAQVSLQQQQQHSQSVANTMGGGNGGGAGTSSNSGNNSGSIAIEVSPSENSSLLNSGVIGSGVIGGGNTSGVAGGKMDTCEPPAKKKMIDHPSTSAGIGDTALLQEKLEQRLGGILCCAVCLDLPKTAMYQVSNKITRNCVNT
uniref:Cysteine and histidine-rich protein 1 n=1 Tax=Ceratitis capitata TaxID=7213 RepID=W8C098_CERCA